MSSQPPPQSSEYLDFVKREVTRLFPVGWDKNYASFVGNHRPNPSSRKPLLSRADMLWAGRRGEFFAGCTRDDSGLQPEFSARYKEVTSAGKCRPLTIFGPEVEYLAPLHKLLYSQLRKWPWLLCGPPTEERITSICAGKIQTSVDLVSASDGLYHSVAETILDSLFFTSVKIPRPLRLLAKGSLKPFVDGCKGFEGFKVTHGQMMGAYLCFPLLCLQSYCAARWASRFDPTATILVNGDDCIISASRGVSVQDYPQGFRLNADKTIVAENVVEVNSTCFLRSKGKWREVRHLRRGGAPTDFQGLRHMASAVLTAGKPWVDAFQRARIGRRWGFLPSQLGHMTYPSYLREKGLTRRRFFTPLPVAPCERHEPGLRRVFGRDPTPVEAELLRSHFWANGGIGGLRRDEWNPSCGSIRRTYEYRAQPCKVRLSFVGWVNRDLPSRSLKARWFLLPEQVPSEEEERGLLELELWRFAASSLAE